MSELSPAAADWLVDGYQGISSKAIFTFLHFGRVDRSWGHSHPLDPDDLRRCELLLRAVPELRPRLSEMAALDAYWAALVPRWAEIVAMIEEEAPGTFESRYRTGPARRAYALMSEIEDAVRKAA